MIVASEQAKKTVIGSWNAGRPAANKGKKLPPEPLTEAEAKSLCDACSRKGVSGVRNAALIALLYAGGLRITEALRLKPADVDLDAQTVRVLVGKGKKARTSAILPLPWALTAIQRWIGKRDSLGFDGRQALFCTHSSSNRDDGKQTATAGRAMQSNYVRGFLKRLSAKAGIAKRVHPHAFRHSHAVKISTSDRATGYAPNVIDIQRQLGHTNLNTTQRYLVGLGADLTNAFAGVTSSV